MLELNRIGEPGVSAINEPSLRKLVAESFVFAMAEVDGAAAGFMIALVDGASYESPNYRWFSEKYDGFAYMDRLVVDGEFRKCGVGRAFYEHLAERARAQEKLVLTCEVNLQPPNPESLAFHDRIGFEAVGEQDTEGGKKRVCLMAKTLA